MYQVALTLVVLGGLSGKQNSQSVEDGWERFEFRQTHMGSEFTILLYCNNKLLANTAATAAFDQIAALDATLSDYQVDSELMRFAAQSGGPSVPVSDDFFTVLARSKTLWEQSNGAFEITIGPVVKLWRRARRRNELPEQGRIEEALGRVGSEYLILDEDAQTARLSKPRMQLDAGGIAKGFASDRALEVLRSHGIACALVAGAGDIVVGDPPPGREAWRIAIQPIEPEEGQEPDILYLTNAAVSTSGDTERFVEVGGIRYSHIVDPKTGIGLTTRRAVTVIAPNGISSDSLATTVSVLGSEAGLKLIEELAGTEARITTIREVDGREIQQVDVSNGFSPYLKVSEESATADRGLGGLAP